MKKFIIFIIFFISACATRYSYEQLQWAAKSWLGKPKDEYVRANGIPFREYRLTDGTTIIQYKIPGRHEVTDGTGPNPSATSEVNTWNTVYEEYSIGPSNTIMSWKARN